MGAHWFRFKVGTKNACEG